MPFSTACNTPLSNFESGQNYKDVVDPAGRLTGQQVINVIETWTFLGITMSQN